jgi:hypothetical protein
MKKALKNSLKCGLAAVSVALVSACGGGGETVIVVDQPHSFLSVDNIAGYGVVCVEDIFLDANSAQGQQAARDIANYYGIANLFIAPPLNIVYSAPTYCGGPTSNYVPAPGLIIDAGTYYNVIVPAVR